MTRHTRLVILSSAVCFVVAVGMSQWTLKCGAFVTVGAQRGTSYMADVVRSLSAKRHAFIELEVTTYVGRVQKSTRKRHITGE
jgi:hypothetical protein